MKPKDVLRDSLVQTYCEWRENQGEAARYGDCFLGCYDFFVAVMTGVIRRLPASMQENAALTMISMLSEDMNRFRKETNE